MAPPTGAKEYVSGEGFYYLGRTYRLQVIRGLGAHAQLPELRLFQGKFQLRGNCIPHGRQCFIWWYSRREEAWLAERLP